MVRGVDQFSSSRVDSRSRASPMRRTQARRFPQNVSPRTVPEPARLAPWTVAPPAAGPSPSSWSTSSSPFWMAFQKAAQHEDGGGKPAGCWPRRAAKRTGVDPRTIRGAWRKRVRCNNAVLGAIRGQKGGIPAGRWGGHFVYHGCCIALASKENGRAPRSVISI